MKNSSNEETFIQVLQNEGETFLKNFANEEKKVKAKPKNDNIKANQEIFASSNVG